MKIRKFNLEDLNNFITGITPGLVTDAMHKYSYIDGKRTDTIESTTVSCVCKGLGEVSLIFPPSNELLMQLADDYPFGTPLDLTNIGVVEDVNVSIYDNNLMFKIKMRGL